MPHTIERWKPERTHATAYLIARRIVLHGDCLTTSGGFACEPYLSIDARTSDAEIGAALVRVLAEARVATVPTNYKELMEKTVGTDENVRLLSNLSKGVCCSVVQMHGEIWILPTRREGRAVTQVLELKVRIPESSTPEEVGRALRDGFRRCT
jgi:hypothetical protein